MEGLDAIPLFSHLEDSWNIVVTMSSSKRGLDLNLEPWVKLFGVEILNFKSWISSGCLEDSWDIEVNM